VALLACWAGAFVLKAQETPPRFAFAVLGDMPYNPVEEARFPDLIEDINSDAELAFVVHVGDFKSGGRAPCSDKVFEQAKSQLDRFRAPLIYTPGDNEWTDCRRRALGGYDPLERLAKLREIFFRGEHSLGQAAMPLTRQSGNPARGKFRENTRWIFGGLVFTALHIVGSNNNLGRDSRGDAEHRERMDATLQWMREAFALARRDDLRALVLFLHANPGFERRHDEKSGFRSFLVELEREAVVFKKPVLLIHGDTHTFRVDRPLRSKDDHRPLENFIRLETFGSPNMNWVKVVVDPQDPELFQIAAGTFSVGTPNSRATP
jgi:hypothetical protein